MEEACLSFGLLKAGFSEKSIERTNEKVKIQRFISFYGCCPKTFTAIFMALKESNSFQGKVSMVHLFLGLTWLKTYMTERCLAGFFGLTENTVRKKVWQYTSAIQSLKPSKVRNDFLLFSCVLISIVL